MLSRKRWLISEAERRQRQRNLDRVALLIATALAAAVVIGMLPILKYILG